MQKKIYIKTGKSHLTTDKTIVNVYAKQSEELIDTITNRAADLGLKVNGKKLK